MMLAAAIVLAIAALAAAGYALFLARRSKRDLGAARARLARIDADHPASDDEEAVGVKLLQRDVRISFEVRDMEHDHAILRRLLVDFRDVAGADEAIFWRMRPESGVLFPGIWSSDGPRPTHFNVATWAPLVQWSAETGIVQTVGHEEIIHVAAASVKRNDTPVGVLSLTANDGLALGRVQLKEWVPRLAAQLSLFDDLLGVRRHDLRHIRRSQALLDAVQRLQSDRGGEGLIRTLCETTLDVSGARGAVLVRWDADAEVGELLYATEGTGLNAPATIDSASVVGEACRSGKLQVLVDARFAASGQALYGVERRIREPGSVAIIPLTKDGRTLGALILEAEEVGALTYEETQPLKMLVAVVAGSIEMAWQLVEVDHRSRTDSLTGLFNRRHFGEQLARSLGDAERSNRPASLVLVDIDHFKRVNDTWGHEAGDEVLRQVARVLHEGVRSVDVCVRYGGEEIAMLLGETDSARAEEVAERLRKQIEGTVIRHSGREIRVTASFGVATYPETVKLRDQLFPAADKALYIAKHEGRNRVSAKPVNKGRTAS